MELKQKISELQVENISLNKKIKELYTTAKQSAINDFNNQQKSDLDFPNIKYYQGREEMALELIDLIEVLMNW